MKNIYQQFINTSKSAWAYHKIITDENGNPIDYIFLEVNPAFEKLTGLKSENIIEKKISEINTGITQSEPDLIPIYGNVALSGKNQELEVYFEHPGRHYSIMVSCPEQGYFISSFEDITETKQKEKKFQTIFQSSFDGFWICNTSGKVLDANDSFCELLGYSKDEMLRLSISDFEAIESTEDTKKRVSKIIQTGKDRFESKHITKSGATKIVENNALYLPDNGGRIYVFTNDITQKKQDELKILESERKYKNLTESSEDHIFNIGADLRVTYINRRAAQAFQSEPEKIVGKHIRDIFPPHIAENHIKAIKWVIETGEKFSNITESAFPGGNVWLDTTLVPNKNEQHEVVSVIGVSRDVTIEKNAEIEIIKSENRFSSLINATSSIVWRTAGDGTVNQYQPGWGNFTGQDYDAMKGWGWLEAIHPDDKDITAKEWMDAVNKKSFYEIEHRLKRSDGIYRYFSVKGVPILSDSGEIEEWIGTHTDITEKKQAESDLKNRTDEYFATLNDAPALIWKAGTDALCFWFNQEWLNWTGRTMEEEMGNGWTKGVHPGDFDRCLNIYMEAFEKRASFEMEYRLKKANGDYGWILDIGKPSYNNQGIFTGYIGYCFDISERIERENYITESEERFKAIFESTNDCILVWDKDYNYKFANQAAIDMVGTSRDKVIGRNIEDGLGHVPDFMNLWKSRVDQIFLTGEAYHVEDKDIINGRYVYSEAAISPIRNGDNEIIAAGVVYRDVTARKTDLIKRRETDEKYKLITEATNHGIWDWDVLTNEVYYSPQWKKQIGYNDDELKNEFKTWEDHLHPDDFDRCVNKINKYIHEPKGKLVLDFRFRHKNGHYIWINNEAASKKDNEGKVLRIFGVHTDITAEKIAKEELLQSEAKYRNLVNEISDGIFRTNLEGKLIFANKALCTIHGFDNPDELIGQSIIDLVREDHKQLTIETFSTGLKSGKFKDNFQVPILNKKKKQYLFVSINPTVLLEDGNIIGVGGVIRDISEIAEAEQKLKDSEVKFRGLFNNTMDGLLVANTSRQITDCNNTFISMFGYDKEEIIGKQTAVIYNSADEFKTMGEAIKKHDSEEPFFYTINYKTKSGKVFPGETGVFYQHNNEGELESVIGVIRDISVRIKAQKALKQSEEKHRAIFESASDAFIIANMKGEIVEVNPSACKIYGYKHHQMVGLQAHELIHSEHRHKLKEFFNCIKTKGYYEGKTIDVRQDGSTFHTEVHGSVISYNNRNHMLAVIRDVSEQRNAEIEKDKALRKLGERIKEMRCLYRINENFRNNNLDLKQLLKYTVDIIPEGFQFPDKTMAQLYFNELEVKSAGNIIGSEQFIEEEIKIDHQSKGKIRATIETQAKQSKVDYFLNEEKELLKEIAFNIGQFIQKMEHEKALSESENNFKLLIQNSPLPKVVTNMEGVIEFSNTSFQKIIGFTEKDIHTVEQWWPIAYPDKAYREQVRELWEMEMKEAIANNKPSNPIEARVRCKDGTQRIFSTIGSRIGEKVMIVFSDLTERIKAEEERDRFFTVSLDLLCIAGTDGYFKRLNPAWENLLGWTEAELKAKPFFDFIHPDDIERTNKEVEKLSTGSPSISFTNRYQCKDGSYKWLSWNSAPFGEVLYAAATDVTDLKHAQNEVEELNNRLNLALEGGEVGIWEWDLKTNKTIWDNRMELMFGLKPNSFDGTYEAFKKRLHPEDVEIVEEAISKALSGEKEYDIIYRSLWENEKIRFINAKAVIIKNATGENEKFIGVCIDVSDLKTAQQEIQLRTEELQRSNQELEQFAYVASHDLQQPLRMVSSYTQLLQKKYQDQIDEKANKYIHYAVDGATRMQGLINDLLSYSRVTTMGGAFEETDMNQLMETVQHDLGSFIKKTNASIKIAKLPTINCDASQLSRVLQNLLENAMKFSGEKAPEIYISAKKKKRDWVFQVKDNGIGIDTKYKEKIFVIFQRLHLREEYDGTGIGLSICKRIINRHGGDIWFESKKNNGTTFFFNIPVLNINKTNVK